MDIQQNYFAFLGLPESYDIDMGKLSQSYLDLQKTLHPDRFAHQSEREKRMSVQYTAYLNEAVSTLKSPLGRAQYLLHLKGIDTISETSVQLDPKFLFEQMELRERLEGIKQLEDPFDALEVLSDEVGGLFKSCQMGFKKAYEEGGSASWNEAASWVRKMQFAAKLQAEIERVESELD